MAPRLTTAASIGRLATERYGSREPQYGPDVRINYAVSTSDATGETADRRCTEATIRILIRFGRKCVARMEASRSSRGSSRRSNWVVSARAVLSGGVRSTLRSAKIGVVDYSSRCSMPFFETFASVISPGIQSGLSSGASSSQAQPS